MFRFYLTILLFVTGADASAQSLEDVRKKISSNTYAEAKELIDVFLKDPAHKNSATAWYYKGKIYTAIFKADTGNSLTYDAGTEAFTALRKYEELDKSGALMILDQRVSYFELFDAAYNKGVKAYNNKDYAEALHKLSAALTVEEYVNGKGYLYNGVSLPKLDTQLVNLTGSAAYLAGREDESVPYFKKLADAGIKDESSRDVFTILLQYYQKKNDRANSEKYFAMAKKLFPDEDYWVSVEFGDPGTDRNARFARYEEVMKKYPANYQLSMDYAAELFNETYVYHDRTEGYAARCKKLEAALSKALSLRSTAMANYAMTLYANECIDDLYAEEEKVSGTGADAEAGGKKITLRLDAAYETLRKHSQAAADLYAVQPTLADGDIIKYKKVLLNLSLYYERKKDKTTAAAYRKKILSL